MSLKDSETEKKVIKFFNEHKAAAQIRLFEKHGLVPVAKTIPERKIQLREYLRNK